MMMMMMMTRMMMMMMMVMMMIMMMMMHMGITRYLYPRPFQNWLYGFEKADEPHLLLGRPTSHLPGRSGRCEVFLCLVWRAVF